jgi:hypothetical protein
MTVYLDAHAYSTLKGLLRVRGEMFSEEFNKFNKFMHKRLAELESSPMPYSAVEYEELKRRYAKVLDEGSCLNARLSKSEHFEKLKVLAYELGLD